MKLTLNPRKPRPSDIFEAPFGTYHLALLIAMYVVGTIGIGLNVHPSFVALTPFNLLVSFTLLVLGLPDRQEVRVWRFLTVAMLLGYWIEVAGVATGAIFGRYAYGEVLGPKLLDVPLLIGVNWAMLTFCAGDVAARVLPRQYGARVLLGALLPVALDVLIEPVAISTGMWHWYGAVPPLQNYLGWFAVSLALSLAYERWVGPPPTPPKGEVPQARNAAAPWLLGLQAVFFLCLQL